MRQHGPTRRAVTTSALGLPLVLVTPALRAGAADAATTVDMETLLLAAQWDPTKTGTGITPGARAAVTAVERALVAEGHLAAGLVDGHYGTATVTAYAAYQRSLGYTGIGANGLPGPTSLDRLGTGRFTVTRPVRIGARVEHRGRPVSTRTRSMLLAAESALGRRLTLTQGSYSPGEDPTSKGTHDGGGVVDIDMVRERAAERMRVAAALRRVGFAAWVRDPSQDDWPWHIHAVAVSDTDLAPGAAKQVGAYYRGRNGLSSDLPDDGPSVPKRTYEECTRGEGR